MQSAVHYTAGAFVSESYLIDMLLCLLANGLHSLYGVAVNQIAVFDPKVGRLILLVSYAILQCAVQTLLCVRSCQNIQDFLSAPYRGRWV